MQGVEDDEIEDFPFIDTYSELIELLYANDYEYSAGNNQFGDDTSEFTNH